MVKRALSAGLPGTTRILLVLYEISTVVEWWRGWRGERAGYDDEKKGEIIE